MRYLAGVLFIFAIVIAAIDVLQSDITQNSGGASPITDTSTVLIEGQRVASPSKEQVPTGSTRSEIQSVVTSLAKKLGGLQELSEILQSKNELEEALKMHPELALQLQEIILDPTTRPRAQLALIHSLSLVGGPQAEHVLIVLASEKEFATPLRLQAISSMAELVEPSNNAISSLWRVSEEESSINRQISESALLNLGIAAHTIAATLPDTAHQIVSRLASLTEEAFQQNASSFPILLESLANSGSSEALPMANKLLLDSTPEVRALGVSAIRLLPGKEIENRILAVAEGDDSAITRSAALEAIHLRQPNNDLISKLSTLLFGEEDRENRRKIITYLGERGNKYPESRKKLRELLPQESDQENYELAVRFIS